MHFQAQHKPVIAISFQQEDGEETYSIRKQYVEFIEQHGGSAVLLTYSNNFEDTANILSLCDGVLIPGGDDIDPALYGQVLSPHADKPHPARDAFEQKLVHHCIEQNIPYLGICRGFQIANVALGGTLHQYIPNMQGHHLEHWQLNEAEQAVHSVEFCKNTQLAKIYGTSNLQVNSIHHQTIDMVAPELEVCAISEDGLVEALRHPKCEFFIGVQWHPEFAPCAPFSDKLGKAFMDACAKQRSI